MDLRLQETHVPPLGRGQRRANLVHEAYFDQAGACERCEGSRGAAMELAETCVLLVLLLVVAGHFGHLRCGCSNSNDQRVRRCVLIFSL